jgi:nitrite reductase/ring-hydroxylating ferredoxin subunit
MQNLTQKFISLLIIVIVSLTYSCKNKNDAIPDVYVNIEIDLNNPDFYPLQSVGNYVYVTGGVKGIIVYRKSFDEFIALERTCPHDPDIGRVFVNESTHSAIDTIGCGSEFSLLVDGMVTEGPSKFPLKLYHAVYYENMNILQITN